MQPEKCRNSGTVPWAMGLEPNAVPKFLAVQKSSHGQKMAETVGTGRKISGTVPRFKAF